MNHDKHSYPQNAEARNSDATIPQKQPSPGTAAVKEECTFEEIDFVDLPIKILGEHLRPTRNGDEVIMGVETDEVQLHWFSINKPIDPTCFTPPFFNDLATASELVSQKHFERR